MTELYSGVSGIHIWQKVLKVIQILVVLRFDLNRNLVLSNAYTLVFHIVLYGRSLDGLNIYTPLQLQIS